MTDGMGGWPAPAKLNLFLRVTGQRADGYHELQTLFQLLAWGDELRVEATEEGLISRLNDVTGIPEDTDLCIRAAKLLQQATGCRKGARIELNKVIPAGAGLGGGSSDAATVLHILNREWGLGLSPDDLAEIGVSLGADVPVFVHGNSAWGEGIGERLRPVLLGENWYVLVFPDFPVSTAEVFRHAGLKRDSVPISLSEYRAGMINNDCEAVVMTLFPQLREVYRNLSEWGVPRMTGTGSCIFLAFDKKNQADSATNALKSRYNVRAVRGVDHSPLLAKLSGES